MNKLKLITILGTRPEIIRLSACIKAFDKYFEHILVHTGQNWDYALNQVFFDGLNLRKPDYFLDCAGGHLGETLGNIMEKSYEVLVKEKPDALIILGDTNSSLSAICAKRLKIPIFHMEAGNRCWDWNVPEMINRKIVDHISDINLPYTENSRRYLLDEGVDGKTIFVTGSPMAEVLEQSRALIEESDILAQLELEAGKYILVSAHREENIDHEENFTSLMSGLNYVAGVYNVPVVYSAHPRSKKYIKERRFEFHPLIRILEPFGFHDYVKLQSSAMCVLSDSGTLSEESAMLGFPGVLIRTSTERPEALDGGNVVIGGISGESIAQAAEIAIKMKENGEMGTLPADYTDVNVSTKVVKIIQSYTHIINKNVWMK
ncbi:MAG: UDP-N-acetylglucosamine 2-epimerase (non-hydrolyzing) [Oscillospiraceae bacterium]|nr:UDP-N-acetylglucosamine 2-epimerase (non-hydrolyzing) [Oscillospiraceae bacterium]